MSPPRRRRAVRSAEVSLPPHLEPWSGPLGVEAVCDGVRLAGVDAAGRRLGAVRVLESALEDCRLDEAGLHRSRWTASALLRVSAVGADLSDSAWQDVELRGCRLSGARFPGARLDRVLVDGGRLEQATFRDAQLTDVTLSGCVLRDVDLSGARLRRVDLAGSDLDGVDLSGARLEDVDLRGARLGALTGLDGLAGAVVSADQLVDVAPSMAAHLGLVVEL